MWPKDQVAGLPGTAPGQAAGPGRLAAITMPATDRHVAFARLATAHLCGAVGMTVSRVADLRLAVDEACKQFLDRDAPWADRGAPLELRFDREPDALRITVRGPVADGWPDRGGLSWLILQTLIGDVRDEIVPGGGVGTLRFDEALPADGVPGDVLWFATS
jgi:hypothetical protein